MRTRTRKTRNKGGLVIALCAVVALAVALTLLLTQCDVIRPGSLQGSQLAELLSQPGDQTITLDGDVVIDRPLTVVGNKTINGTGTIVLDTKLEGQWPGSDNPSWGMGCAKLSAEDASAMAALITLDKSASLTLGGTVEVDAKGNGNGVALGDKSEFIITEKAVVKGGRYANLVVGKTATARLTGGQLLDGEVYNVINYGALKLTGTVVSGAKGGAAIYTTGTAEQTGGKVEKAAFHNVYVAAGTFTMTGGENTEAEKDGVVVANGASAEITGGTVSACVHGLCNNGTMNTGKVELTECGILNSQTGALTLNGTVVDTSEVYCLSNNGGKVTGTDVTVKRCDTVAIYNFSGEMTLKNLTVEGSRDGNIANAGGTLTVDGGVLGVCRDKSITVGNGVATFNNVVLEGTNREKYGVYAYGGELYMNSCSISNVSSSAVKVDAGATVELNDVDIKDVEQNGFQLDGGRIVANNVSMENMGSHGVYNKGGELIADVLSIKNVDKNAIQNISGEAIVKNLIADTMGNHGAYVESGTLTVESGSIANAEANGFYLPENGGKLVLKDVKISTTGQQGINNSSVVEAENITITGTGMNGIYNKPGATMTVTGANIHDVAEHGINNKSVITITDLTVTNTGADSNSLQNNGTMTVTGAKLTGSKNHGLYNTGDLTATDVTITNVANNGVYNDENGTIQVKELTVSATGEHGINNASRMTAEAVKVSDTGAGKNSIQNSGTITLTGCEISDSRNHGIYNTGTLQGEDLTITDVADNGIYNNKGQITSLTGLIISATGGQGLNNTGELVASDVLISATGKNGVYTNGGKTTIAGLTVTDPGEHGVSNDYSGVVTLIDATLDGSASGSNCIQNKAVMHLENVTVKNSSNHGIYNDSTLTTSGKLVVTGAAVNGVYNYGGTVHIADADISATGEHGINNAGTMTVEKANIHGATQNGIQNTKKLTITGSAVVTDSGKHGIFNGKTMEAANVTVTNAGDLLLSNAGDMVIRGLKLTGTAQKAIYNAGYAELYSATVDGAQIRNQTDATAQYLVDINAGVLDLTDSTIVNAWGTALHLRAGGAVSATNVIINGAGNYGIFVGGGSKLSGDGLVINNVTKNAEVSGAEGIGLKIQGSVTMMDHLTIGDYDPDVAGSGMELDKSVTGIHSNNAIVVDAATATFSGYDLAIRNTPNGAAVYNKGTFFVTDLTVTDNKAGIYTRYNSCMTLSGKIVISDLADYAVRTQGDESNGGYKNSVVITEGAELIILNVGGHAFYNGGTVQSFTTKPIYMTNMGGNGIQNGGGASVVELAGPLVIDRAKGHAIYNKGKVTTGNLTITNITRQGVRIDGGSITVNGDLLVDTTGEQAILTSKALTVTGSTTVKNVTGKAVNAVHIKSGATFTTGSLTIQNIDILVSGDNQGNGLYNEGTVTVKGNVTIDNIAHEGNTTNDTKFNGIYNKGTINISSGASVSVSNVMRHGIHNASGTIHATGAAVTITDTAKCGLTIASGTVKTGALTVLDAGSHAINNKGTLEAASITVKDSGTTGDENGVNNNGGTLTVTGAVVVENITGRGVSNNKNFTAGSVSIKNVGTAASQNGIQNTGTMQVNGDVVIDTTSGHGIYSSNSFTAANLTIANTAKNGINNGGATFKVTGTISVTNTGADGVSSNKQVEAGNIHVTGTIGGTPVKNSGTMTVTGLVKVTNVTGKAVNVIQNTGTMTLTDVLVDGVKIIVGTDGDGAQNTNVANGIYNQKKLTLNGTATVTNLFTDVKNNTLGAGLLVTKGGTVTGTGSLVITGTASTDESYPYGINNGIFIDGAEGKSSVNLTGDITVTGAANQGIYLANELVDENGTVNGSTALSARNITVINAAGNGIYMNKVNSALTVTGTITIDNAKGHGLSCMGGSVSAANLTIQNIPEKYGIESTGIFTITDALQVKNVTKGYGIHFKGGILRANSILVDTVSANVGIYLEGNASLHSYDLTVKNINHQGIQAQHANTIEVQSLTLKNITKNGVRLYNNNSNPTVTIGTVVASDITEYAIAAQKQLTSSNLSIGTIYYVNCAKGALHGNIKSGVGQIINDLPAEATASAVEEN